MLFESDSVVLVHNLFTYPQSMNQYNIMTTEEIEKAAKESFSGCDLSYSEKEIAINSFIEGVVTMDNYWQEKIRWIPIEERLPVFGGERRTILVKTGENLYAFLWIIQELSLSDFECQQYTHWKEIEL